MVPAPLLRRDAGPSMTNCRRADKASAATFRSGKAGRETGFSPFNATGRIYRNQQGRWQFFARNMGVQAMQTLWDPGFLQDQIRQFQAQAKTAMHPDVKAAYQSYVQHYQTMLDALQARGRSATPRNA
ncbi:MAG: hypothetical protein KKD64_04220 [Alphaproteobacteria bacterium]|nr:hypothetical protein [Alphaproteobacteria bacterium]